MIKYFIVNYLRYNIFDFLFYLFKVWEAPLHFLYELLVSFISSIIFIISVVVKPVISAIISIA